MYLRELSKCKKITFLSEPEGCVSNRWLSCILFEDFNTKENIRLALESDNIESRPLWKPMHLQPVFKKYPIYGGSTAENLFRIGLCLPSGSNLNDSQIYKVINKIQSIVE